MAKYYTSEPSRTFSEFLLLPSLTKKEHVVENVSLRTPIVKYNKGEQASLYLNIPFASSIMQSVSDNNLAIALARCGGISFIYSSQSIESQAEMVQKVKSHKAGFVISDSNLRPDNTLKDAIELTKRTGHSTIAVTEKGNSGSRLLGILTSRDFRMYRDDLNAPVKDFMTPFSKLVYGREGITISEANNIIWEHKLNTLPIIDSEDRLKYLVFRKDYMDHKENPLELLDADKRFIVGAGINTRDYRERVPALIAAGADILCIDSSDGYTEYQWETLQYIRKQYGDAVKVGGGNIVDKEGFLYLVEAGADFVKVGIGGGSICITREQKGIGRGQASAVMEVTEARNEYYQKTGIYIPICSDGGITQDYHILMALAMGADFVMMGRYFARFEESPAEKKRVGMHIMKEYWGEGSNRARNWQRYDLGGDSKLTFEEGVDSFVPYAGSLRENVNITLHKIKSTMCNCGALTIKEMQENARITLVSQASIREGGAHDVVVNQNPNNEEIK